MTSIEFAGPVRSSSICCMSSNEPTPSFSVKRTDPVCWSGLHGAAEGLAIARAGQTHDAPVVVVADDARRLRVLAEEITFFIGSDSTVPIIQFPGWECLPYDTVSPHPDITSERLKTLALLPRASRGILLLSASTFCQRLPPCEYVSGQSFILESGSVVESVHLKNQLATAGYLSVSQVFYPGEFAVRGGVIDIYPMGSDQPFRLDLFGDQIERIRFFDPESQKSTETTGSIELLPAREYPTDDDAIAVFRSNFRKRFDGDPHRHLVYRALSEKRLPVGLDYFWPLFFDQNATILDYLDDRALLILDRRYRDSIDSHWAVINDRYSLVSMDPERSPLAPQLLFLEPSEVDRQISGRRVAYFGTGVEQTGQNVIEHNSQVPDVYAADIRSPEPFAPLLHRIEHSDDRAILVMSSPGRSETVNELLESNGHLVHRLDSWSQFLDAKHTRLGSIVAPLERGAVLGDKAIEVISEPQIFGAGKNLQERKSKPRRDPEKIIQSLVELQLNDPITHEEHGVGRYRGLQVLEIQGTENEFLVVEYLKGDRLFVPVLNLHTVSRYLGGDAETAPLHRLGSDSWRQAKERAKQQTRDVAAELLVTQASRSARKGHSFHVSIEDYANFVSRFPYAETEDQKDVMQEVLQDLESDRPMDRLVCGDVGFGKTEIALRAAFVAVDNSRQVAVLVPTTLLAQQHFHTFRDRFAHLPVVVELLSRFRSRSESQNILQRLHEGSVDIVIGTHRLLQKDVNFLDIGLLIVDEEQRFGVRQKERLKALRETVDILTLTATPIPRTLNVSIGGLREISLITTAPEERIAIQTFIRESNDGLVREACLREIQRGGQVYFLHNEVRTIESTAERLGSLLPEARISVAHGQMPERDLDRVMQGFYHQRYDLLVCSTIIESGIDVPNANTIIINRADRFGLAQLHQLRGRVGRSHHQAYAYLLIPRLDSLNSNALKRLEAIESLVDLGAGFTLASHDLEIRGAGELLGEQQSGSIDEIGFTLYAEYLRRAIEEVSTNQLTSESQQVMSADHPAEIDLNLPTLFPDHYIPDVHTRLVLYKRIGGIKELEVLYDLQLETIDRFGLLPDQSKALFRIANLKIKATKLGINKITLDTRSGKLLFGPNVAVDPVRIVNLVSQNSGQYAMRGSSELDILAHLPEPEERIEFIDNLLDQIKGQN